MFKSPDNAVSIGDASKLTVRQRKRVEAMSRGSYIAEFEASNSGERAYRRYSPDDMQQIIRIKRLS